MLPIVSAGNTAVVKDSVEIALTPSLPKSMPPLDSINAITPSKPTPNIWTVMQKWIFALPVTNETEINRKDVLQKELKRTAAELVNTPGLGGNGVCI